MLLIAFNLFMSISTGSCGIAALVSILDCHLCASSVVVYNFLQFALIVGMPTYLMAFAVAFALWLHTNCKCLEGDSPEMEGPL